MVVFFCKNRKKIINANFSQIFAWYLYWRVKTFTFILNDMTMTRLFAIFFIVFYQGQFLSANAIRYNQMEIFMKNRTHFKSTFPDVSTDFYAQLDFVYSSANYNFLWNNKNKQQALLKWINNAPKIGFDNAEIKNSISEINYKRLGRIERVINDIEYTIAYIKLYDLMYNGNIPAEERGPTFHLPNQTYDTLKVLTEMAAVYDFSSFYSVFPKNKEFFPLIEKAVSLYDIYQSGGWPPVEMQVDSFRLGMRGETVLQLKERLRAGGYYHATHRWRSDIFDRELESALKQFQFMAVFDSTGVLDKKTLDALNADPFEQWQKIVINIERWLWFPKDFGDYYAKVNIPAFRFELFENDSLIHAQKVVVGRTDRETPIFYATMTYMDFNPTWTVPPNILAKDIVPAARKSPSYLQKKSIKVIDYSTGKVVNYSDINWSAYRRYAFVQDPGPSNSLGNIKFVFPNKYFIFFHDTPTKSHFALTDRAYSSGCIRLEDAFTLARYILRDNLKYTEEHMNEVIKTRKTTRVPLTNQPMVYITYFTVQADEYGRLHYYRDLYGHDRSLMEKLNPAI
jgi:L,D-transpeptidase YcbB